MFSGHRRTNKILSLQLCPSSSVVGYISDGGCCCSPSNTTLAAETLHLLPQTGHCEGIDSEDETLLTFSAKTTTLLPFPAVTTRKNLRCSEGVNRCKDDW
ncbi:unnamed protein product [Linum trigynum]|uniref:Uncharacterized protein n=1 Tax=Linum trigynum TaxID=586398 RepID=A0AAV2E6W6_9ROSI